MAQSVIEFLEKEFVKLEQTVGVYGVMYELIEKAKEIEAKQRLENHQKGWGRFTIEFFELAFLAEACIPPRPIARAMLWQSLTDKYWYRMTEGERIHLFEWLQKSWVYEESLKKEKDTQEFHARFNPDNQYMVKANFLGKEEEHRAFKIGDRYYVKRNTWISEDHIVSIEKFIPKREY